MTFKATEFETLRDAADNAAALGGEAVLVCGRSMVVDGDTLDVLFGRVDIAYICDMGGNLCTVPAY